MTASSRRTFTFSTSPHFLNSAKARIKQGLALSTTLLLTVSTFAQQAAPTPPPDSQNNPPAAMGNPITVSVPAGTRIALVLTQPVQTRYLRRGDDVYAQITSPVASGNEVVIPPALSFRENSISSSAKVTAESCVCNRWPSLFPTVTSLPFPAP